MKIKVKTLLEIKMSNDTYKMVVIGSGGVGKTTYIKRMRSGKFINTYTPTMGVEVHPLHFHTNKGKVTFNVWDCSGQERFDGLKEGYYIGAHAYILMFDVTSKLSLKALTEYLEVARKISPNATVIVCGTKIDCKDKKVTQENIGRWLRKNPVDIAYYISAKSNYNFEKPFLYAIRKLLGNDTNFGSKTKFVEQN